MSVFNEEHFKEVLVSQLALFDLPPTQTSVNGVYYEEERPVSQALSSLEFIHRIPAIIVT